jgi:hypothetical protein
MMERFCIGPDSVQPLCDGGAPANASVNLEHARNSTERLWRASRSPQFLDLAGA